DVEYSPVGAPFHIGASPYSGHGPAADLTAASTDAAFNQLGLQLLHEYCWAGDQPLMLASGEDQSIESAREGQVVLSASDHDPEGPRHENAIAKFLENGRKHVINLYVEGRLFRPTPNHPIYARGRGFVPAGELSVGDELLTDDHRWVKVSSTIDKGEVVPVFNLMVPNDHTYFVGSKRRNGFCVLVHNQSPGDPRYAPGKEPAPPRPTYGPPAPPSLEDQRNALIDEYHGLMQELKDNTGRDRSNANPSFDLLDWFGRLHQWAEKMSPFVAPEQQEEFSKWKSDLGNMVQDAKNARYLADHPRGEIIPDDRFKSDMEREVEAKSDLYRRIWGSDASLLTKIGGTIFHPGALLDDFASLAPAANGQGRLSPKNGPAASRPGGAGRSKGPPGAPRSKSGGVPPIPVGRRGGGQASPVPGSYVNSKYKVDM
ncbi:MAG: Hint domain-containing protein, partial [Pirellulales bacterium]